MTGEGQIFHKMSAVTGYSAGLLACTLLQQVVKMNKFHAGWLTNIKNIFRYSSQKTQMDLNISTYQSK